MPDNNERLTSSEISNLWTHYIRETMQICVTKYFLPIIKDPEIHKIYTLALEMSENHVIKIRDIFHKENFPIPKGFTKEDVNLHAPPLFTDAFSIFYIHTMTMHGSQAYNLAFSVSIRKDIRDFYYQCNLDTMDLYNKSFDVMQSKQLYDKPPFYETPSNVSFINSLNYVTDVLGERRKMNSIESGNIFFNLQKSLIAKACFFAFNQVCKDKEINHFINKCINRKNKHIGVFSNLLLKEDLHSPRALEPEVVKSTISPFSDKLMLFHSGFLIAAAISYYGSAIVTSIRADITYHCEKAIFDDLLLYGVFGKLLIKKKWLEQPPFADDRKLVSETGKRNQGSF
ncbi:DUF3231 family protein [Heyndrickxia sp. FSL W8-0423]|uniref:DUF3231 family protein n=1 Tax=Heyndrickxia sp. FSL W8-0423 TaxID=2921601 RepID=UPI0030F8D63E